MEMARKHRDDHAKTKGTAKTKTAMWELENRRTTHDGRPAQRAVIIASTRGQLSEPTSQPLSLGNHLLARLVHQGSDPTLPYQALVIRESARLC
jgi:hypothetical protein